MIKARENPFRVERVREVLGYDLGLVGTDWGKVMGRLESLGRRGAVAGPHGSGKTTFLDALETRLVERGQTVTRLFLNREQREIPAAECFSGMVFLDGCEQLGWREWRRFLKRCDGAAGLVVTVHAPGRLPTLLRTETNAEMFAGFVRQLAGDGFFSREECDAIYRRHGENVREALRECYDRVGNLKSEGLAIRPTEIHQQDAGATFTSASRPWSGRW